MSYILFHAGRQLIMKLTKKELELIRVLLEDKKPITVTNIVERLNKRTWNEKSVSSALNNLVKKKAVIELNSEDVLDDTVKSYLCVCYTLEQYAYMQIRDWDIDLVAYRNLIEDQIIQSKIDAKFFYLSENWD